MSISLFHTSIFCLKRLELGCLCFRYCFLWFRAIESSSFLNIAPLCPPYFSISSIFSFKDETLLFRSAMGFSFSSISVSSSSNVWETKFTTSLRSLRCFLHLNCLSLAEQAKLWIPFTSFLKFLIQFTKSLTHSSDFRLFLKTLPDEFGVSQPETFKLPSRFFLASLT